MGEEIELLIRLLAKVPGLGPRSARRAALHLVCRKDALLVPLGEALRDVLEKVSVCPQCGNVDSVSPCGICRNRERDAAVLCVVESVGDLWALERAGAVSGRYHVLGGTLSAFHGVGPEELGISRLHRRAAVDEVHEVILAMNATMEGQATAHYITEVLEDCSVSVSRLAHGVPVGGELDYLDEGTLSAAIRSRRPFSEDVT